MDKLTDLLRCRADARRAATKHLAAGKLKDAANEMRLALDADERIAAERLRLFNQTVAESLRPPSSPIGWDRIDGGAETPEPVNGHRPNLDIVIP